MFSKEFESLIQATLEDGILEDYVSKRGIMAEYASRGRNARTVKEIADRAKAGLKNKTCSHSVATVWIVTAMNTTGC